MRYTFGVTARGAVLLVPEGLEIQLSAGRTKLNLVLCMPLAATIVEQMSVHTQRTEHRAPVIVTAGLLQQRGW